MTAYGVLLGIARLVRDYRELDSTRTSKIRRPNAVVARARPDRWASDGFIELVARSSNGCGSAAYSEITVDAGEYAFAARVPDHPAAKRLKGTLDAIWAQKREASMDTVVMDIDDDEPGPVDWPR